MGECNKVLSGGKSVMMFSLLRFLPFPFMSIDSLFLFKLVVTFLVGSLWLTGAIILAERFGSKIGGVIAWMPSTIVIALFFIGWTQTPVAASQATVIVPLIMGIDAIFIITYASLVRRNFPLALLASLFVWLCFSFALVLIHFNNFSLSLIGFLGLLLVSYVVMEYVLHVKSLAGRNTSLSFSNVLMRGLVSGVIITLAVAFAKLGGPLLGGVFASFPAVFLSTMILTYFAQGRVFSVSVMKTLMLSGTINATVYASAVRYLYPLFGLIGGTISSFLLSLLSLYVVFLLVKKIA
jgi:hypothetical protein